MGTRLQRALIYAVLLAFPLSSQAGTAFAWPGGARAAVSLAYDDALDSQLDNAIPALDKAGLRASFYLQLSNPTVNKRLEAWRAAAKRGHELGNHTLFHQCSSAGAGRSWVEKHRDLATTSVQQMKDQILLANTMLYAIDGRRERTLTLPCGDLLAAGKPYLPEVVSEFVAVKAGSTTTAAASMDQINPGAVPVIVPVGASGKELIALVEAAGAKGTMINFTFHGIGGDYLEVSTEAHQQLIDYLAAHRKQYWTDSFVNIMKHVRSHPR
ncbi:MAG TPA: polysaccharide deacetylase family protein [Telluria sp.]